MTGFRRVLFRSDELDGTSEALSGLIETNADVEPGDSGGALVDTSGRVVGIDTAASSNYSLQSSYSNAGYAIPIAKAEGIARQIVSGQASSSVHIGSTAFLGVGISSSSGQGSSTFGGSSFGSNGSTSSSGATIEGVIQGGSAASAGLAEGDVITSIDGRTVSSPTDLSSIIGGDRPGQTIKVTYTDTSGATHTATVTLQAGPPA